MEKVVNAIGDAFLSTSIQRLFDGLNSIPDLLRFTHEGNIQAELKKWGRMLKRIYLVLDDAEERQWENPLVKMWVSDLRDLAYDAEDVLDELATEAQRRKLQAEPLARASKVRKIISTVSASMNLTTLKFSTEIVSKIEGISTRLDEIIKEKEDLHLGMCTRGRTNQMRARLPTTSLVNESKIYGREQDKKEILELLKKESSGVNVSVIPIVGMGGVGKTTLAQLIFNVTTLEFDLKAWVSVGEDFDVLRMTKTILHSVGWEDKYDKELNLLQIKLKEKLSQKKFLIVLDDVWTESYDHWTLFRSPFDVGAPGSRIIITTRNESVSSMMGTIRGYSLEHLSCEDCLSIFAQHALGATNFDEHLELEEIGKEIVKRCKGLPLAAKALGGLLRGSPNRNVWEEVLHSDIWDLPDEKNSILPALRLSYFHLPSHLKQCFAYCAIFPKDFEFDRDELVLLWMAEGFLYQSKKMKPMQDIGCEYFDDLLSRSFFQQSSSDKSLYVMHDLMNDLAKSVTKETCFHLGDKFDTTLCAKVRHSSFTSHRYNTSQRFEVFHKMMGLRTFLAMPLMSGHCRNHISSKVLQDLVPELKCLRVLSLSGYHFMELPNSIGALKHLRYLNLSHTRIERLPDSVTELLNLQTLLLNGCFYLIELPSGIGKLINLQCLDISGTVELEEMPLEIGNLAYLHTLTKFIVGKDNGLKITELNKFSHLSGMLHISGIENVLNFREAEFANLKEKQRLEELDLEWAIDSSGSRNPRDEVQVLNSLRPPQNLLRLSIKSFGGTEFPSWIGDPTFTNMARINLWNCRNIMSLPPLGQLPSLEELSIGGMNGLKRVGMEFHGDGSSFASLKTLTIENMLEWEQWSWSHGQNEEAAGTFPNLRKLKLGNCPKLVCKLPSCLQSLRELSIASCHRAVLGSLYDITSLTALYISDVSGLVSLQHMEKLVALEDLTIQACNQLKYLWKDGGKLACLKHLDISFCRQLESLVEGKEGQLPCNLKVLKISDCNGLVKLANGLDNLSSLRDLSISFCQKLLSFPAAGYLLRHLEIQGCDSLDYMPKGITSDVNDMNQTSQLETLKIGYCNWPAQVVESVFRGLSHLRELRMVECPQLTGLPIHSLISLTISGCENFRSLPNQMQNLTSLTLYDCGGLECFPEVGLPPNLTNLSISNCGGLESFPRRGLPPKLTKLSICYCKNLKQPMTEWGLHKLPCLRYLGIWGTSPSTNMFDSFPDDDGLLLPTSLTYLRIRELENLKSISRGVQKLASLRSLRIVNCRNLLSFPEEGFPATLEHLWIDRCPHLNERCSKDKGDYWPIISHIAAVTIYS
ncbi:hypothetical protein P3X46_024186 [Hevea brasiliensis]|uniref:Disease resistance RPP13-like protein 1 n=2 Tax=Hevea brasiliensis TaxID=3981 RepID=A0ABQ9L2U1_HEVBR|nr:hypothetical protein P3X46_024186 [Hevea brasiliensis]